MFGVHYILAFAASIALVAAAIDYKTGHIPNWLTLPALALAPLLHLVLGSVKGGLEHGVEAAGCSLSGAAACAVIPLVLYRAGAIGGGDVKLLAALGALCRPMIGVEAEFYAFLAAALFAPAKLAWEGKLLKTLGNTLALMLNPVLPKHRRRELSPEMMTSLRFGPAIFVGVVGAAYLQWRNA